MSISIERQSRIPNIVVRDSAASKNSLVDTALFFSLSTGTSVKDLFTVSRKVPPGGYAFVDAIVILREFALLWSGIGAVRELRWSKGEAEDWRRGIPAPPRDCEDVTALL